jgi:hypothetical protein
MFENPTDHSTLTAMQRAHVERGLAFRALLGWFIGR